MADPEEWRPVLGHEGYEVSNLGRVRSIPRRVRCGNGATRSVAGRILTTGRYRSDGRQTVAIGRAPRLVAHLVLEAFVGPRPPGMCALHGRRGLASDELSNLRWGTHSENNLDRVRDGTDPKRNRTHCPRGHLLVPPNLTKRHADRGLRTCRACGYAASAAWRARRSGKPFERDSYADARYERIMSKR